MVFYDQLYDQFYDQLTTAAPEDKSGIRTVNSTCPLTLYPEHEANYRFQSAAGQPLRYQQVVAFENVIQTDTVSVLLHFLQQLRHQNIEFIQTDPASHRVQATAAAPAQRAIGDRERE